MSGTKSSDSESELSSNSSWTILEESENDSNPTSNSIDEKTLQQQNNEEIYNEKPEAAQPENDSQDNGFLTFDEFLQERMLEYDYEHDSKLQDKQSNNKQRRKSKAETIHILTMLCSFLILTGLTLLCLIFPQNVEDKYVEKLQNNYKTAVKSYTTENLVENLNHSVEMLEMLKDSSMIDKIKNELNSTPIGPLDFKEHTMEDDEYVCLKGSRNETMPENNFPSEEYFYDEEEGEQFEEFPEQNEENVDTVQSNLTSIKKFMSKTNLLAIFSCIMHNICILKLVNHLYKERTEENKKPEELNTPTLQSINTTSGSKVKKGKTVDKLKNKIAKKNKKPIKEDVKVAKREDLLFNGNNNFNKIKNNPFNFNVSKDLFPNTICAKKSQENNIFSLSCIPIINKPKVDTANSFLTPKDFNTFKYEKRTTGLERYKRKAEDFGERQRKRIKSMKENYKNDVAIIKNNEKEITSRAKKITLIRDNFIEKLRKHRERYLSELRKLKHERQLLMKQVCSQKQIPMDYKDVAVGNYAVPVTGALNFEEKIKLLQLKECVQKPLVKTSFPALSSFVGQNESKNNLSTYKSTPCFNNTVNEDNNKGESSGVSRVFKPCMSLLDDIISEAVHMVDNYKLPKPHSMVIKGKIKSKKHKEKLIIKKNINDDEQINNEEIESEHDTSNDEENTSSNVNTGLVRAPTLYTALFDKSEDKLKEAEKQKHSSEKWEIYYSKKHLSKQDPHKGYKEKVVRGH